MLHDCSPLLKDEIFCQLMRQTTSNPLPESLLRGWKLLRLVCGLHHPSEKLFEYFSVHAQKSQENAQSEDLRREIYSCRHQLERSKAHGPRKFTPTLMEVKHILQDLPISIRVLLLTVRKTAYTFCACLFHFLQSFLLGEKRCRSGQQPIYCS